MFTLYLIGMVMTSWIVNISCPCLSLLKAGFVGHLSSSFYFQPKQNLEHWPGTPCRCESYQIAWQMNCDTSLWRLFEVLVSMNFFFLE